MNIGISLFSGRQPIDAAAAQKAEVLGFDSLWLGEHPFVATITAPGSSGAASLISIVDSWTPSWPWHRLAVTTRRFSSPTALRWSRSAIRSSWRKRSPPWITSPCVFGIGAGWNKEETELMGGNFVHRWTQTREAIEAMKALLGQ